MRCLNEGDSDHWKNIEPSKSFDDTTFKRTGLAFGVWREFLFRALIIVEGLFLQGWQDEGGPLLSRLGLRDVAMERINRGPSVQVFAQWPNMSTSIDHHGMLKGWATSWHLIVCRSGVIQCTWLDSWVKKLLLENSGPMMTGLALPDASEWMKRYSVYPREKKLNTI